MTCVAALLETLPPSEVGRQAAWKPRTDLDVAQTCSRGSIPTTSVHAERQ
jgi:hypothetical protein